MKRGVAEGRAPRSTCMAEVMTDDPFTISMNKDLENCITLMRRHSFRHLPACHEGHWWAWYLYATSCSAI